MSKAAKLRQMRNPYTTAIPPMISYTSRLHQRSSKTAECMYERERESLRGKERQAALQRRVLVLYLSARYIKGWSEVGGNIKEFVLGHISAGVAL